MNQTCSFSTCFTWFLLSSQAPNFKWALSINNLMELASEWKGGQLLWKMRTFKQQMETTKVSWNNQGLWSTNWQDKPFNVRRLSQSADVGNGSVELVYFFVLVCLVYPNDEFKTSIHGTQHQCWVYMEMLLFCVSLGKRTLLYFQMTFFGWVTSKEFKTNSSH